jgi:hypothetical protein
MKNIAFLIPVGSFARLLLRSGVLEIVRKKANVTIITPAAEDKSFVEEFMKEGVRIHKQATSHRPATLLERLFYKIRNSSFLRNSKRRYFLFERFENWLFTNSDIAKYLKQNNFDLIVTASPGIVTTADLPYLRAARATGIPAIAVIQQWDNLSTKGLMPFRPEKLCVWNNASKKDAIELQYYDAENVIVSGVPHFDLYNQAPYEDRETFFKKLKLDSSKPLITFTTAPYKSVADHTYVIDAILKAIAQGRISKKIQLLCRLHPLDERTRYAKYKNENNIVFDYPGRYSKYLSWDPDLNETKHLVNTLYYSDIVINIASTITIEAAILDKPIINLGFSSSEPERFKRNILIDHHKRHYKYILAMGGIKIANNENEFIECINMYLSHPEIDSQQRRNMAEELAYKLDGKSSLRVAETILRMVKL